MKQLLILIGLATSVLSNAQTISTIYQKQIDTLAYHKIFDVHIYNDKIYILGSSNYETRPQNYLLTRTNFDGEVISQHKITSGRFDFLNSLMVSPAGVIITGGTWNQSDEGTTDFIGLYDFDLNLVWQRQLDKKWEGALNVIPSKDGFFVATNDDNGVSLYSLNSNGQTLKKESIASMNADNLFRLSNKNLLLVTLTMNQNGESEKELITLTADFEILNKSILPIEKRDYLKRYYVPNVIKPLNNQKIVSIWTGKPPLTTFLTATDTITQTVNHIRHDLSLSDIEPLINEIYIYSGALGKQAAIFIIEGNKIIDKATFGAMGTWSTSQLFRVSDSDYILVTDKIRTNNFETNIEIIRVKIKQ